MALAPIDAAGNAAISTVELRTSPQVNLHLLQTWVPFAVCGPGLSCRALVLVRASVHSMCIGAGGHDLMPIETESML